MKLENTSFLDGLYFTVITVATVGYGDMVPQTPTGKTFAIFLVFSGVGLVMYSFSKLTEAMVEGGIREALERKKMDRKIDKLKDHHIICGFGRIGKVISKILKEEKLPFVIVERDPEELKEIERLGYFSIACEASDDDSLLRAGIERAKGLVAVVSSDADNLYITLTARGLNPDLFILARSSGSKGSRTKLLRAGASKVISPYYIGARRMASLIVRPAVTDFIDLAMYAGDIGLTLEQVKVPENTAFAGQKLRDSGIRKDFDLIVVAIKQPNDEMIFNPGPDTILNGGDTLIVLGNNKHISGLKKLV